MILVVLPPICTLVKNSMNLFNSFKSIVDCDVKKFLINGLNHKDAIKNNLLKFSTLAVLSATMVTSGIAPGVEILTSTPDSTKISFDLKKGIEPANAAWFDIPLGGACMGVSWVGGPLGAVTCQVANPYSFMNRFNSANNKPVYKSYKKGTSWNTARNDCHLNFNKRNRITWIQETKGVYLCVGHD